MASPFAVFRRNQKIMIAVVGVLAMIAFVFLTPLAQFVGGKGPRVENPVVVETRYGDLRARDLEGLGYQRQLVDLFLQRMVEQSTAKQFGQANIDSRWLTGMLQQQYLMWRGQVLGRSVEGPEAEAVETMVLAERAKQMGVVITDQMINDLITQISGDALTPQEVQAIIRSLQPQRPVTVPKLFEALRTELLASKYRDMFAQSLTDVPPAQRFDYYSRLNRRAKTEVMTLAVADFASEVPDPSESEVKEFYEKYKNQLPDPTSPEPGFKEPKRATFQYFKASVDQLTEKMKDDVTEDEIKKYYEENKRNFIATNFDDMPGFGEEAPKEGEPAPEGEAKPDETPAPEEKPAEEEPAEPKANDKPAEETPEEKPAEENPVEDEAKPEESSAETTEPADDGEKPADEEKPDESPQANARGAGQVFRLVSTAALQEEASSEEPKNESPAETTTEEPAEPKADETPAEEPAGEEKPAEEKPAPEEKPAEEKPEDQPSEEKPAEEKATDEMPAEEKPAEEKATDEMPAEEKPADAAGDAIVAEPAVPAAPQYEPLEKVQDTIRETLARQKAAETLASQFEDFQAQMRRYTDEYDIYTTEKGTNPKAVMPAPLNFAELAKDKDVQAFELKSVSPIQAAREDIGKAFRVVSGQDGRGSRTIPFLDFAFSDSTPTFKPEVVDDNENNYYLFWKTDEEPSYVPPLDQIHDEVVRAWKLVKARELARKRGEEYAQQATKQDKSLEDLFGKVDGVKVTSTAPFSWMTLGNVPSQPGAMPRLSEVEGLDQAGPDFMKTVFGLQAGGVGVALNVPEDEVFVVKVTEFEPTEEALRDGFARENPTRYMSAAREDQFKVYRTWISDLNKEADVHWLRQADARNQTSADDSDEL